MNDTIAHIDDLIITYLAEGLEGESLKELNDWISTSQENYSHFMELQEVWLSVITADKKVIYNKERAFQIFKERTQIGTENKKHTFVIHRRIYQVAAVAVLLIVAWGSYWQGKNQIKSSFSDIIVEAPLGSKTKVYLPDGTLVWLNAGSSLIYSQGFGVDNRNVQFEGEGYFEVVKNSRNAFTVNTRELQVKVLGTKFNIKNYVDDKEVVVNLIEGKVMIDNLLKDNNIDYLSPNEKVVLNKKTGVMAKSSTKSFSSMEWTNDILFFDEELLPDIVKRLERGYNIKIEIADESLHKERFYGIFSVREQNIQEVLDMLTSTGKIKYEIKEKVIILY